MRRPRECPAESAELFRNDIQQLSILSINRGESQRLDDEVVVEEPLELRVNNVRLTVTMRTPGDDFDLAAGLLWTEGWIHSANDIGTIAYCPNEDSPELKNIIHVILTDQTRRIEPSRNLWASSSCGICGKSTIESIRQSVKPVDGIFAMNHDILSGLPGKMRALQAVFTRTGGIHAAALFDALGNLSLIREDLGRHNAVDKVLGAALRGGLSTCDKVLVVSGRLGFEITQKAAVAEIPIIASVSAPSSLAIALADDMNMTAIGFVRGDSMNIYTHPGRVIHGL